MSFWNKWMIIGCFLSTLFACGDSDLVESDEFCTCLMGKEPLLIREVDKKMKVGAGEFYDEKHPFTSFLDGLRESEIPEPEIWIADSMKIVRLLESVKACSELFPEESKGLDSFGIKMHQFWSFYTRGGSFEVLSMESIYQELHELMSDDELNSCRCRYEMYWYLWGFYTTTELKIQLPYYLDR